MTSLLYCLYHFHFEGCCVCLCHLQAAVRLMTGLERTLVHAMLVNDQLSALLGVFFSVHSPRSFQAVTDSRHATIRLIMTECHGDGFACSCLVLRCVLSCSGKYMLRYLKCSDTGNLLSKSKQLPTCYLYKYTAQSQVMW